MVTAFHAVSDQPSAVLFSAVKSSLQEWPAQPYEGIVYSYQLGQTLNVLPS
jgi:hypothetical protein